MNTYIFKTTVTMKEYNNKKWWIDGGIITEKRIAAETIAAALKKYQAIVEKNHYVTISDNAIKSKSAMYVDMKSGETKQVGYVITGKTEFEYDRDDIKHYGKSSMQYVDLWISIITVVDIVFTGKND